MFLKYILQQSFQLVAIICAMAHPLILLANDPTFEILEKKTLITSPAAKATWLWNIQWIVSNSQVTTSYINSHVSSQRARSSTNLVTENKNN